MSSSEEKQTPTETWKSSILFQSSVLDCTQAPLHSCSLESIPDAISLVDHDEEIERKVWPLMMCCYQLENDGSRLGQMDLFLVPVPDLEEQHRDNAPPSSLAFGTPYTIHGANEAGSSSFPGLLDGKWFQQDKEGDDSWYFAAARSSGQISIDSIQFSSEACGNATEESTDSNFKRKPFSAKEVAASDSAEHPRICLALNWDRPSVEDRSTASIVSSYSDGRVAIHDVAFLESSVQLIERESWTAHVLFGDTPSEVWSACFLGDQGFSNNMVLSGGDDAKLKLWDVRSTTRPMQVLQPFAAGITVVSQHPRWEHVVACGSYDETVALYDVRYASQRPLSRSPQLGGGIWRIQWHPIDDQRVLLAAMHGGCRVMQLDFLEDEKDQDFNVTKEFKGHKSLAYGAAWLVHNYPNREDYFEAAASCSFYDRAAFLWNTK